MDIQRDFKVLYSIDQDASWDENEWRDDRFWKVGVPGYYEFKSTTKEFSGRSVIIVPGGAYAKLNPYGNGFQYASWLAAKGIHAYVLIHRLPQGKGLSHAISDMKKMIQIASTASNGGTIGLMGCSAGGHLCAVSSSTFPGMVDFCVLLSPVITMDPFYERTEAHQRTYVNLLGKVIDAKPDEWKDYCAERLVSPKTPPTIIFHSQKDQKVNPSESLLYFKALHKNNVTAALNIYSGGQHDFRVVGNDSPTEVDGWMDDLYKWILTYTPYL